MKPNKELIKILKSKGIEAEPYRDIRKDRNLIIKHDGKEWAIEIL